MRSCTTVALAASPMVPPGSSPCLLTREPARRIARPKSHLLTISSMFRRPQGCVLRHGAVYQTHGTTRWQLVLVACRATPVTGQPPVFLWPWVMMPPHLRPRHQPSCHLWSRTPTKRQRRFVWPPVVCLSRGKGWSLHSRPPTPQLHRRCRRQLDRALLVSTARVATELVLPATLVGEVAMGQKVGVGRVMEVPCSTSSSLATACSCTGST